MIDKAYIAIIAILISIAYGEYSFLVKYKHDIEKLQNDNYTLKLDLDSQNDAIQQIVIAQNEKQKEILKAEEDAALLKKKYDKAAEGLLAQNVPNNCEKSVQWGIDQANIIYECWIAVC